MRRIQITEEENRFSTDDSERIGNSMGLDWDTIDLGQFAIGMNVETEHDDVTHGDPLLIGKIAWAHLREKPNYYVLLLKYVE